MNLPGPASPKQGRLSEATEAGSTPTGGGVVQKQTSPAIPGPEESHDEQASLPSQQETEVLNACETVRRDAPEPDDTILEPASVSTESESDTIFEPSESSENPEADDAVADSETLCEDIADLSNATMALIGAENPTAVTAAATVGSSRSKSPSKNRPPRFIGDYEILAELGRGGMGVVYKARHKKLQRVVALKMILSGAHNTPEALQRFLSEARAVAQLQHPSIVQIFDIGEHEGLPFFSLEFVEGTDLQKDLDGKPCSAKRAAGLVESVCRAMHYAHENGILHRDLKPANILLNGDGVAKVSDFGLAKEVDAEGSAATNDGTIMGSPSYMPPEQAKGELKSVTAKSDQYSLGAVLYQMLTARPPFLADRPFDTVMQVITNEAVAPRDLQPGIPEELETICLKALQKDQKARYDTCEEMANDLRRFLNGEPILAKPVSRLERAWRWCKRNPKIAIPSAVASVFVASTAVIATWAWLATAAQAQQIEIEKENVVRERDEAEFQRGLAMAQKKQAEENEELARRQATLALQNIQYVLTEIDTKLKAQPATSDLRIAILEAVSKKWNDLDVEMTGGVRGEAIPTLMALRQQIAIAFTELDKLKEADAEFEKLFNLGEERVKLKGSDAARTNQAKIAMAWAPVRRRVEANPDEAMQLLKSAIELVEACITDPRPEEGSPTENEIRELLAVLQQNLGVEYLEQGQLPETSEAFEKALRNMDTVLTNIRSEPGYEELDDNQKDTLTAMKQIAHDKSALGLAYILIRMGQTKRSIELYNEAIAGRREIYQRRPEMLPLKVELAGYLGNYGQALYWIDDLNGAEPILEESLVLSEEITETDPEKADFKRALSTALYRLGTLRDLQEDREDEANRLFVRCEELRAELNTTSPDQKNKVNYMLAAARAGSSETAETLINELGALDVKNGELHLERARALTQLARRAQAEQRERFLEDAMLALKRAVAEGYSDPFRIEHEPDLKMLRTRKGFSTLFED